MFLSRAPLSFISKELVGIIVYSKSLRTKESKEQKKYGFGCQLICLAAYYCILHVFAQSYRPSIAF